MNNTIKHILRIPTASLITAAVMFSVSCSQRSITFDTNDFTYSAALVPNPMKGFAAFYGKADQDSSMEYIGVKFNEIYTYENGQGSLDTAEFDRKLSKIAKRGNAAIVRVYILNPGHVNENENGLFLPEELYNELKSSGNIHSNRYENNTIVYPNFNSEKLIGCMTDFISLFAKKYDGHPSIAVVQMGLYGSWGEWNMFGCTNGRCTMTNDNLRKIVEEYVADFHKTKLMARNPSLGYANEYPIGYHDDNFMFNTSDFHTVSPEWKALLRKQDYTYGTLQQFYDFINGDGGKYEPLWDQWKTQMFGGEMSRQMYMAPFGPLWSGTEREALDYCIQQFHMSWMMGVGDGGIPETNTAEYQEFKKVAGSFGYDLSIQSVIGKNHTGKLETTITNTGIAPFYYDWPLEYRITDEQNQVLFTYTDQDFALSKLLPDETAESVFFIPDDLKAGEYSILMRFVNPAEDNSKKVMPLRLSNDHEINNGMYELAKVTIE